MMKKLIFLLVCLTALSPFVYASEQAADNSPFLNAGTCSCGGTLYARVFEKERHCDGTIRVCQHGYNGQIDLQYQLLNRTELNCGRCGQASTELESLDLFWYCHMFEQIKSGTFTLN